MCVSVYEVICIELYIYIHSQMISIIDNIISAMSRCIFAGFKNPLNPRKPMGFVESQSSNEII